MDNLNKLEKNTLISMVSRIIFIAKKSPPTLKSAKNTVSFSKSISLRKRGSVFFTYGKTILQKKNHFSGFFVEKNKTFQIK
jgi:hypothetical protein